MNGKFRPPLLKFEEKYNSCKPGRIFRFTSTDDYNNIASIARTKRSSDTILLYHKSPGSLKASIDANLDEIFTEFGYYDRSWTTNTYLKLESPGKNGEAGGSTHTYTQGASQMETDINSIINGGKITKYYINEDGYPVGVTTGGLEVRVDKIGAKVDKVKDKSAAGFEDPGNGNSYYNGSKDDEDDEDNTKKYLLIGLAVVAVIVTFIILKKKKII